MSVNETKVITWERYEAHGFPHFRSRGTASRWELGYDGDGWCLSQDGALLEWYGVLDVAMAWVGEEERRLGQVSLGEGMGGLVEVDADSDGAGGRVSLALLQNQDADLEIRLKGRPDELEVRFLDQPRPGETLVIGHYPRSWPWLGCYSTPTHEDMETVNGLVQGGRWQVIRRSERWAGILKGSMDGDGKPKFLVTLERKVALRQFQEVEVEVEAADGEEAERRAILGVEDDDFDEANWEVIGCDGPSQLLHTPSAVAIEETSGQ